MSRDTFEDELRTLLHDAADAERDRFVEVDPASTLGDGVRVVRRRRLVAAAVTSVLALVVGIGGWATLSDGVDRAQELPASPTTSPTAGEVPSVAGQVELPVEDFPVAGVSSVRVVVDEDELTMAYELLGPDGAVRGRGVSTVPTANRAPTWDTVDGTSGVVVGVLPPAQDILGIWADGSVGGRAVTLPVPRQARSAFVLWNPESPDLPLNQMLWTGGGVFSGVGKEVPSVTVNGILGFVDPLTDLVGVGFGDDLAVRTTDQARVDELLVGVLRSSTPVAANSVFTVVVVPPGGTIVAVAGPESLRVSPVRPLTVASPFEDIGPERLAVTVRLDSDEPVDGTGIDSVLWTDADGTRHDTSFADVR